MHASFQVNCLGFLVGEPRVLWDGESDYASRIWHYRLALREVGHHDVMTILPGHAQVITKSIAEVVIVLSPIRSSLCFMFDIERIVPPLVPDKPSIGPCDVQSTIPIVKTVDVRVVVDSGQVLPNERVPGRSRVILIEHIRPAASPGDVQIGQ